MVGSDERHQHDCFSLLAFSLSKPESVSDANTSPAACAATEGRRLTTRRAFSTNDILRDSRDDDDDGGGGNDDGFFTDRSSTCTSFFAFTSSR